MALIKMKTETLLESISVNRKIYPNQRKQLDRAIQACGVTQKKITHTTINESLKLLGFIANKNPTMKLLDRFTKTIGVVKRQKTQNAVC